MDPNLHESAWERAKADAEAIYRSTAFYITEGIVGVIAAGIGILLTTGADSTQTQVVVPILAGIIGVLLPLAAVLAVQVAATPRRQRDELRAAWPSGPIRQPVNVELTLRNFIRQAEDYAAVRDSWYREDMTAIEDWTNEVIAFLGEHATEHAAPFTDAVRGERSPRRLLLGRANVLREIVSELESV